jgi:hypothetical protein
MTIIINHQTADTHEQAYLTNRGAPKYLFGLRPIDLTDHLRRFTFERANSTPKTVDSQQQITMFRELYKKPLASTPLAILSCLTDKRLTQIVGLAFFRAAFSEYYHQHLALNSHFTQPYWHHLQGGKWDPWRDDGKIADRGIRARIGCPCFLILDGLTVDASVEKWEKAQDLLDEFSNLPRIVLAAGALPALIAAKLYTQPKYVLNLVAHAGPDKGV